MQAAWKAVSPIRGDAGEYRISATAGFGDLASEHLNFYVSGYYLHSDPLYNSARPYPYNSVDGSGNLLPRRHGRHQLRQQ